MLIPSTLIAVAGTLLIAMLAGVDWYVWGLNLTTNPRQPRRPQALTGLELLDMGLARLVSAHRSVLPKAAFEAAHNSGTAATNNPDDGFKRVA